MKVVHVQKIGGLRSNGPWVVADKGPELRVEDDIDAPLGWIWNKDYRSGRPEFTKPEA